MNSGNGGAPSSWLEQLGAFNRQNCANVLWGFAKLNHRPTALMPCMCDRLIEPEFLDGLKPVEVADTAYALSVLGTAESEGPLLEEDLLTLWDRSPQPPNVRFIFFSLSALHLFALHSIALFDLDESEAEPRNGASA